jgi:hypothetical protein
MQVLVTLSDQKRLATVVDLESGDATAIGVRAEFTDPSVVGRARCRPFGITWSPDELFIVNNRMLHVFDKHLNYLRTSPTRLQVNMHQLAYNEEIVWAVSPWTNSIIAVSPDASIQPFEFDIQSRTLRQYSHGEAVESDDKHHFNSLLWADGCLFVAAHAFGDGSFINCYDQKTLRLMHVQRDVGSSIHGLARYEAELYWISTDTREVRSDAGYCLRLPRPGYARGFAMTRSHFIVATSERLSRGKRHTGDSWIHVIDRLTRAVVAEIHLPDTGSINDLRLLDGFDYAHPVGTLATFSDHSCPSTFVQMDLLDGGCALRAWSLQ